MSTRTERHVAVVIPAGEVDMSSAPKLRRKLDELLDDGFANLVIDLTEVTFFDSSGLAVLVGAVKQTKPRGGSIRLAGARPLVLKILELTRLTDLLPTFHTVDEAVNDAS